MGSGLVAFFAPSPTEQHAPGFNLRPIDTTTGLAEDVSFAEDEKALTKAVEIEGTESRS